MNNDIPSDSCDAAFTSYLIFLFKLTGERDFNITQNRTDT